MIRNLKIHTYKAGRTEPEVRITIPLSAFHIAMKILPTKTKDSFEREGIDLTGLTELFAKEGPKGELIEIENTEEKLVILLE